MSFQKKFIIACGCAFFLSTKVMAGSILVHNNSDHKIKVASIGGSGMIEAKSSQSIEFKNTEIGADINIWWVKNARELCQIYTPWNRTILVSGKHTITCLSKQ
jgi:hypothetical protein